MVLGHLVWVMTKEVGEDYFRVDTSVIPQMLHPVGSSKECWIAMSNGKFRKAGESLEQEDPGDLEEIFLKKRRGGTRLFLCGIWLVLFLRA